MKKVCILQNSMTYGGTDTFVINLGKGLIQDGYDVTVVLSVDEDENLPREAELEATGVHIIKTCHLRGTMSKLRHLKCLYSELRRGRYDVFQTNIDLFNGPQMLVAWLARIPVRACHSHNSEQGRELSQGRTFSVRIYQGIMRWLCWTFSNRRCGCSEQALKFLFGDHWKKDPKAKIIHNGIDFSEYTKEVDRKKKKCQLGLTNTYNICTIGRISFQKNPEFILDIFYELSKLRDDVDLVWCGSGEEEENIRHSIQKYQIENRVHLLGMRNDIPEILKSSDLFLLPSRFEGLGIVLVEAQAAGLPCIISDVVPREVDCGLCWAIPLEKNAQFWADKISEALDNKITMKLDVERLEKFSIDTMVKEMEEVFE